MSMTTRTQMARTAGLLYLTVVLTGIFSLGYVPSRTIVPDDGAATVNAIMAAEPLFRLGIAAGLVCYAAFLLLPLALYRLLSPVGRDAALLMVAFALVSVPISFANLQHKLDILSLLGTAGSSTLLTPQQVQAEVMQSLKAYRNGILVAEVFWGLWLLPLGYLVMRSGFVPRILGVLLMLGCFGYLLDVFGDIVHPGYATSALAGYATLPASLGEIGTCLWLLFIGVTGYKVAEHPPQHDAH